MTIATDAPREAAVPTIVDADPVRALRRADRDGLLTYHGFVAGGRYEIEVADRRWEPPAAEVPAIVERLRAVKSVATARAGFPLVTVGVGDVHVFQVGARLVKLPAHQVVDWVAGFTAAGAGQMTAGAGRNDGRASRTFHEILRAAQSLTGEQITALETAYETVPGPRTVMPASVRDAVETVLDAAGQTEELPDAAVDALGAAIGWDLGMINAAEFGALTGPWTAAEEALRVAAEESAAAAKAAGERVPLFAGLPVPVADDADLIGAIDLLFDAPTRNDQSRMVILGLMHGRGDAGRVTTDELADRTGKSKKTIVDALAFGHSLAPDLAEEMIAAFGLRWSVTAGPVPCEPADGDTPVETLPEMPGLVALRRIAAAARAGWVSYGDTPSPNRARWNQRFQLAVGHRVYVVGVESLPAWLDGVEAFHTAG